MTPRQTLLVKTSFRSASLQRDRLQGFFFAELFARDASLWRLFKGSAGPRGSDLFEGLFSIVGHVDRLYPIFPVLEWLAFQGARRGVGERQYEAVAQALIAALESGMRASFTAEHREAWTAAYRSVARVMAESLEKEPLAA